MNDHERGFDSGYSAAIHDARVNGSRAHYELGEGVRVTRSDIEAIERLSDAAIRAGSYETAVEGYALALRLRSETGFHPLRRESDEPVT